MFNRRGAPDGQGRRPFRVATWNLAGAFPRKKDEELWDWLEERCNPDVVVLTEARPPGQSFRDGWEMICVADGVGPRRRWGTLIASRDHSIVASDFRRKVTQAESSRPHPAATFAVDVVKDGKTVIRVLGHYGLMLDEMNGFDALDLMLDELHDLTREHGRKRTIVAGDFNLWPDDVEPEMKRCGFVSSTSLRGSFPVLHAPVNGSRIWTHKNGNKDGNGKCQELDFIFLSKDLVPSVIGSLGGVDDFPDSWDMSDHAPVVVDLDI